jgi:[ribosomal protein S5]-alanine N-acetyltransferase
MSAVLLETDRLRLETWGPAAMDDLLELHGHPKVSRFLDAQGRSYSRESLERRLAEWSAEWSRYGLGKQRLVRRSDDAFVGRAGFSLYHGHDPEIGYALMHRHWGQGYASEIATALRDWVFDAMNYRRFIGFAHVENFASRRVMEKIGMKATHQAPVADMPHQFYALERAA